MPKSEKLTRVELCYTEPALTAYDMMRRRGTKPKMYGTLIRMNVLVDADPELKVGKYITLADSEDPERRWLIERIHETLDRVSINRGWNNNI